MISGGNTEYAALVADARARAARAVIPQAWDVDRIFSHWWIPAARVAVLAAFDVAALVLSALIAYGLWAYLVLSQPVYVYQVMFAFVLMAPVGYGLAGLYPGFGLGAAESFRRLWLSNTAAFLMIVDLIFLLKLPAYYSRMTFALAYAASLILVPTARLMAASLTERWSWWRKPALLAGDPHWSFEMAGLLNRRRSLGYRPIGMVPMEDGGAAANDDPTMPRTTARMLRLAETGKAAVIVQQRLRQGEFESLVRRFRHVMVLMEDFDGLPIENSRLLNFGSLVGLQFTNNLTVRHNRVLKRALDTGLGCALLVVTLPVIALAAGLVMLCDGAPAFYCQEREGQGGRMIRVWKLRTMRRDSERLLKEALARDPELQRQWDERCKLTDDPRIIPIIGSPLRRFSIDELPQLLSVAKGEMSMVGPRPFPEYHLRRYSDEYRALRRIVRPGLTGLCQVMVRGDGDLDAQRRFDTYYICNWSVWLDLYIMARTFWAVVTSRGAY